MKEQEKQALVGRTIISCNLALSEERFSYTRSPTDPRYLYR